MIKQAILLIHLTIFSVGSVSADLNPGGDIVFGKVTKSTQTSGPIIRTKQFYNNLNNVMSRSQTEIESLRGASSINVYNKASRGTVLVVTPDGVGSGVLLTTKGHIITNNHVVGENAKALVFFKRINDNVPNEKDGIYAEVIKIDEISDLVLLKLNEENIPSHAKPIPFADNNPRVGSDAHAIGHPSGYLWSYTRGYISQVRNNFQWNTHTAQVIQVQTPINPGNSGGPLLDSNAFLIGINTFKEEGGDGLNFAVSLDTINSFLSRDGDRLNAKVTKKLSCQPVMSGDRYFRASEDVYGDSYNQDYDVDCDGKVDTIVRMPIDEAHPSIAYYDSNKDGKEDIVFFSITRDDQITFSLMDSNFDGIYDFRGIHKNGNAVPEKFEAIS
jgi:S1-C subfamily serine protease